MIINVKSETGLSGFYVIFDGSTMNESKGSYGLSHLMEHLMCKSFEHLQNEYQQKNIKWNAYTSNTDVVFYMMGLDRHINDHKEEFLNLILSYEPTQEELDNEKKIVLEEYKRCFNSQEESHYLNLHRKIFNYYGPIGLRSDIENFTLESCKEFLNLYYKKPTRIINISKYNDFDVDINFRNNIKVKPFTFNVNNNLHIIKSDNETKVPDGLIPVEIITEFKNKVSVINLSQVITEDFTYAKFLCSMLGSGLNSPLYQEVREKLGLVYSISCFVDKLNNESCNICIMTDTSEDNVDIVQEQIKNILENKENFLTQERFDILKDNYKTKFEEAEILNYNNIGKYINDPVWKIETIIDTITLQDIYNMVDKYLNWNDIYKSIDRNEFK